MLGGSYDPRTYMHIIHFMWFGAESLSRARWLLRDNDLCVVKSSRSTDALK